MHANIRRALSIESNPMRFGSFLLRDFWLCRLGHGVIPSATSEMDFARKPYGDAKALLIPLATASPISDAR
jgi:hypothetical protein